MSERLPWFRCFPSALLGAMAGLSADEGIVYLTTLLRIYEVGGPVRETGRSLSRRTGLSERRADAALDELVLMGKVERHADGYLDSRTTHAEIEWQLDRRDDQSAAGKASAARRQKQATAGKNDASRKTDDENDGKKTQQNQQNGATAVERPLNHLEEELDTVQKKPAASPEQRARESFPANAFETWWDRYPHKVGKGAAERSFDRVRRSGRASYPDLMNGLEQYIAGKPFDRPWCNPATWLNQARWLDEHTPNGPVRPGPPPGQRVSGLTALAHDKAAARQMERNRELTLDLEPRPFPTAQCGDPAHAGGSPSEARRDERWPDRDCTGTVHDFPARRAFGG